MKENEMNIEEFRNYCLEKKGVTEGLPFDDNVLVFKVGNKIFALLTLNNFDFINLKCDPEKALLLREEYSGIRPGYHMSKKHWNSVYVNDDVSYDLLLELADHSYALILSSLTKKLQKEITEL
ncbi:MAG: putative DNA-binding protein (MmcQ/YjbR family) [Patiriisocius sp.]|jgi:predicted DNA-binding protein (MmcQ/YjbR family)